MAKDYIAESFENSLKHDDGRMEGIGDKLFEIRK